MIRARRRASREVHAQHDAAGSEVGVGEVEHSPRCAQPEPRVVRSDLGVAAVEAHDELLAGMRAKALAVVREPGFRFACEPARLLLDRLPRLRIREHVGEGAERVAVPRKVVEDALLGVVELRLVAGEAAGSKLDKAQSLGVAVLDEAAFKGMLD